MKNLIETIKQISNETGSVELYWLSKITGQYGGGNVRFSLTRAIEFAHYLVEEQGHKVSEITVKPCYW